MFPSFRTPRNIGSNVSATVCPRLPGPLGTSRSSERCRAMHMAKVLEPFDHTVMLKKYLIQVELVSSVENHELTRQHFASA